MAILPARHTETIYEGTPASAFSRGDAVGGSLAAVARLADNSTAGLLGFALADSNKSINGKVPVSVPTNTAQVFWADVASGATMASGESVFFARNAATGFRAVSTATSVGLGYVVKGVTEVEGQSGQSRILVRTSPSRLLS